MEQERVGLGDVELDRMGSGVGREGVFRLFVDPKTRYGTAVDVNIRSLSQWSESFEFLALSVGVYEVEGE